MQKYFLINTQARLFNLVIITKIASFLFTKAAAIIIPSAHVRWNKSYHNFGLNATSDNIKEALQGTYVQLWRRHKTNVQ